MHAIWSDLVTTSSDPEHVMHWAIVEVGAKSLSFDTALLEPAVKGIKLTASSFMERLMAALTVTKANKDTIGTAVKRDSDAINYKQKKLSKSVAQADWQDQARTGRSWCRDKSRRWGDIRNHLTKWIQTLQSLIAKAVESLLEEVLQASYFNLINRLKSAMALEQALGEVPQSSRVPAVSEAEPRCLFRTKAVLDKIVQSVLFNTGSIVPIAETVGKIVEVVAD